MIFVVTALCFPVNAYTNCFPFPFSFLLHSAHGPQACEAVQMR